MRIQWIELNGFKSFPERTKIELNEGITCFVGPNGTGKSNIVDAFRWIFGEHNPRVLRGEKMEEIIFQGSSSKKEKALAEVTILLSINKESQNGSEAEKREIEIKRRFYRTGESYFLINGKQSRLKDIKEIFLSEGVDIRTYSIIDQFKLNEILFKPSSRKALLEECAGISLYKIKKAESEGKLHSAKENLQRIEDILIELKKQYLLLERQAKRAEKYKKVLEELTSLELKVAKKESTVLFNKIKILKNEIESLGNTLSELEEEKEKVTENIKKQKNKVFQFDNSVRNKEKELKQRELEQTKIEKELALFQQDEQNKEEYVKKLKEETQSIKDEIDKNHFELSKVKKDSEELEKKITNLQNEIILYEESILKLQNESEKLAKKIEIERKLLFNLSTELANKKNNNLLLRKNIENNKNKLNYLFTKKNEINQRVSQLRTEINLVESKIKILKESLQRDNSGLNSLLEELSFSDKILEDSRQKLIELKKTEAVISGKIDSLTSEIWQEDSNQKLFLDCIEVSSEVEGLIESLFEDKLKAVVIEDINDIKPSDSKKFFFIKRQTYNEFKKNPEGVISRIKDFVKIKDSLIGEDILEEVFIVENLNTAIRMREKFPNYCFLTKRGEILFPDGFIKIGRSSNLLQKRRILEELKINRQKIQDEITLLDRKILNINIEQENLKKQIEEQRNRISKNKVEIIQSEESLKGLNRELEQAEKREKYMENEEKTLKNEVNMNSETLEKLNSEIEHLSLIITETEEKIEELKELQSDFLKKNEEKKENLSVKKAELSALKERLKGKNLEILRLNENIKTLSKKREKNEREIEEYKDRLNKIKKEQLEKTEKIQIISVEKEKLKEELDNLEKFIKEERKILEEFEKKYQNINEKIQETTLILGEKKAKEGELSIKLENLWTEIYNLYGKDILKEDIEPSSDIETSKGRITQLKTQLRDIGPVDVEILKEYREVKERYEFLFNQQKDIKTSIEELEEAINKINSLTRKKLKEAFELLRTKFNSVFQELFEGGRAEILLTDENNILDAELEINVQPPGKKLNSINLLSGGEKTLTALAFVFACLFIRSSPVCILDEVDAPLDDSNTLRFRKLIKELSDKIQFLIITHNKLMMECADYIYGVTMQQEGVSKILSIELKEVETYI